MQSSPSDDRQTERVVSRDRLRRRLPSGRALVGGMLVTVAGAGILVAHRAATQPPTTRYVIATRAVATGEMISPSDLGTIALDLPADMAAIPADDASDLVGRVVAAPLSELSLVRPADVLEAGRFVDPESVEISLDLPPARALDGIVQDGDRVDVLATDPDSDGTTLLASGVRISSVVDETGGGIGASGTVRIVLSLPSTERAELLVDAALRAELTLVLPRPVGQAVS